MSQIRSEMRFMCVDRDVVGFQLKIPKAIDDDRFSCRKLRIIIYDS